MHSHTILFAGLIGSRSFPCFSLVLSSVLSEHPTIRWVVILILGSLMQVIPNGLALTLRACLLKQGVETKQILVVWVEHLRLKGTVRELVFMHRLLQ